MRSGLVGVLVPLLLVRCSSEAGTQPVVSKPPVDASADQSRDSSATDAAPDSWGADAVSDTKAESPVTTIPFQRLHPNNPRYVLCQDRPLITWSNLTSLPPIAVLQEWGFNHVDYLFQWKNKHVPAIQGQPLLSGDAFPAQGNLSFNPAFFEALRSLVSSARDKGICVTLALFNGALFESGDSRWQQNPWNAAIGGPISNSTSGLLSLLTLENYDAAQPATGVHSSYDPNWPEPRRVQYRIEEILNKIDAEIGDLDNWMVNVMWEISDQGEGDLESAKKWAQWVAGVAHRANQLRSQPYRLVFTGETHGQASIKNQFGDPLLSSVCQGIEGSQHQSIVGHPPTGMDHHQALAALATYGAGKARVMVGDNPLGAGDQAYTGSDVAQWDAKAIAQYAREQVIQGIHPSTPFYFTRVYQSESECSNAGTCKTNVDYLLSYFKTLRAFVSSVNSWDNEPGDEITSTSVPAPP